MEKASDEIINKMYAEYKQRELNEKGEKTGKALGKHVINLYSTGIFRMACSRHAHSKTLRIIRLLKIRWLA